MLCVRTGASQPLADVDAAEHARRFARRPEPEKTRETFQKKNKKNASQQLCAFGHRCMARHCLVNSNSGTAIAGLVAVMPFGNRYGFSRTRLRSTLVYSTLLRALRKAEFIWMLWRSPAPPGIGLDVKVLPCVAPHLEEAVES